MTIDELKTKFEQWKTSVSAELHTAAQNFIDFIEGQDAKQKLINDAVSLLESNGYVVQKEVPLPSFNVDVAPAQGATPL